MFTRTSWVTQPPTSTNLPEAVAWLNGTSARASRSIMATNYFGSPITTHIDAGKTFQYLESQYVNLDYQSIGGPLPSNLKEATLIAIVRPLTAAGTNDPSIITVNNQATADTLFHIRYDIAAAKFWFQARDNAGSVFVNLYQSGTSPLNQTHVVVATYSSGGQRIYVNGKFEGSDTVVFTQPFDFNRISFGALDRGGGGLLFEGFLPFAAVYPREFTRAEAAQLRTPKDVWKLFAPQPRQIWIGPTSSGASGTLSRTNINDTLTASGTTNILGSLARTNLNDALASSGTTQILGTFTRTNALDVLVSAGSTGGISGTLNQTNINDTLVSTGTSTVLGTFTRTALSDVLVSAGNITILGTFSRTNNNDILSASGFTGLPPDVSTRLTLTNVGK